MPGLSLRGVVDYVGNIAEEIRNPPPSIGVGGDIAITALITDTVTLETVELLHFADPENNVDANWAEAPIRSRSEPLQFYSETGPDTWSFNFTIAASVNQRDGGDSEQAYNKLLLLKSFAYPDYEDGQFVRAPHLVYMRVGRFFEDTGIMSGFRHSPKRPYISELPGLIDVSFTFKRVGTPLSASDVRNRLR